MVSLAPGSTLHEVFCMGESLVRGLSNDNEIYFEIHSTQAKLLEHGNRYKHLGNNGLSIENPSVSNLMFFVELRPRLG